MASFQESEGEEGAIEGIIWLACRGVRFISFHCIASFRIGHPLLVRQLRGARDIEVKSSLVSPRERGGGGESCPIPARNLPPPCPSPPQAPPLPAPRRPRRGEVPQHHPKQRKAADNVSKLHQHIISLPNPKAQHPSPPPPPPPARPQARAEAARAAARARPRPRPRPRPRAAALPRRARRPREATELSRRGRHFPALSRKDPPFSLPPPRKPRISGPSPRPSRTSPEKLGQEEGGVNRGVEGGRS